MELGHAEDRHEGVADVFLHGPAVVPDDLLENPEDAGHQGVHRLGVHVLRKRGEALHV